MNINNMMAVQAQGQMRLNNLALQSSLQKLSSGYRINSAADDAAGLAISERMRAQMTGLERAMMNAQDGMSLVQTAEGAMTEVNSMLNRLTDLAGQASNGILNASQRQSIQNEANAILKEMDRVSGATNFNGIKLLDGSLSGKGSSQVAVSGVAVGQTAATAGQYDYSGMPNLSGLAAGDTVSFNMAFNNGTSQNLTFTMNSDLASITGSDGAVYTLGGAAGSISSSDFASALAGQLRGTAAGQDFDISAAGGTLTLQNKQAGTEATQIGGFSYQVGNSGSYQPVTGTVTAPADARADIAKADFGIFDGTNMSSAAFTVNGQKFALVNESGFAGTVAQYQGNDVNFIKVAATTGAGLDIDDLSAVAAAVNGKTGMAFQADANGVQVKAPSGGGLKLQVGDTAAPYNVISVGVGDMSAAGLGLKGLDFTTQDGAARALSRISAARDTVSGARGDLGATQNRLEHTINSLGVAHENITASESRIRDVDMAKELMNFTKRQLLGQVSQAMLGQANAQSAQVLQLLR